MKKITNISTIVFIVAMFAYSIYLYHLGIFESVVTFTNYIHSYNYMGIIVFILIQIIQVVIPIIPGGLSTLAGVIIFGTYWGFLYSYIGIVIGSFILFGLTRYYGQDFVKNIVGVKLYNKYEGLLDNKYYDWFFALMIFLPVAPDDALVALTGLTKMSFRKFSAIIILCKPLSIFAYGLLLQYGGQWLINMV